jgi:hypothetical protein
VVIAQAFSRECHESFEVFQDSIFHSRHAERYW